MGTWSCTTGLHVFVACAQTLGPWGPCGHIEVFVPRNQGLVALSREKGEWWMIFLLHYIIYIYTISMFDCLQLNNHKKNRHVKHCLICGCNFLYQPRGKESLSWFLRGTKWDALRENILFKQIQLSNTRLLSPTPDLNEPNASMRSVAICKGPLSLQMKGWYFEVEVSILERNGTKTGELGLGWTFEPSSNLRSPKITVHGGFGREI